MSNVQMKLELIPVPVTDVDRAKAFYVDQAGFSADHDHEVSEEIRFVQLTPPGSACSISIGRGLSPMQPGALQGLQVVVEDIGAARDALAAGGIEVSRDPGLPVGPLRVLLRPRRQRLGGPGDPALDDSERSVFCLRVRAAEAGGALVRSPCNEGRRLPEGADEPNEMAIRGSIRPYGRGGRRAACGSRGAPRPVGDDHRRSGRREHAHRGPGAQRARDAACSSTAGSAARPSCRRTARASWSRPTSRRPVSRPTPSRPPTRASGWPCACSPRSRPRTTRSGRR